MKTQPNQKIEDALDEALAETFPASDPVARLQPTAVGDPEQNPAARRPENGEGKISKDSLPRAAA